MTGLERSSRHFVDIGPAMWDGRIRNSLTYSREKQQLKFVMSSCNCIALQRGWMILNNLLRSNLESTALSHVHHVLNMAPERKRKSITEINEKWPRIKMKQNCSGAYRMSFQTCFSRYSYGHSILYYFKAAILIINNYRFMFF